MVKTYLSRERNGRTILLWRNPTVSVRICNRTSSEKIRIIHKIITIIIITDFIKFTNMCM